MTEKRPQSQYSLGMLALYFGLAFAISWAILIPALAFIPEEAQTPFIVLFAFGPFLAALITIWAFQGRKALGRWLRRVFRLRAPLWVYLSGAFLLPVLIGGLHFGLYRALGGAPGFSEAIPWYLYLVYLIPTALLTGGNEEPVWRGFALPALLERVHPLLATLILGVLHAAWHLPLMAHYNTTFGWYVFNLLPLTALLNGLYLNARKSIWPVMLLHAGTNVIGSFLPAPADVLGGFGTYMVLRGLVYWAIAIVLVVSTRGTLGGHPASTAPVKVRQQRVALG